MNKKIIFSLLLIAFVAIGAAAASDNFYGSHRPQLAVSGDVVSDLEGSNVISSDVSDVDNNDFSDYGALSQILSGLDSKASSFGGVTASNSDFRIPGINFDVYDHPTNPFGPKGPILQ